ncbi:glutathione S-transferase [Labrys miyagiensis]|uniref:Glutathione S-transferase n=1 Tax=Labrys miyagiensis TaxID=346912 RepID=A0ABQ6CUR3_9HYPH|nr:glutathione S-transferase family protein [Labrys miyagiensis]GLS24076.1 glutathione S-transferase [Labrys miyagiensis]
MSITLFGTPESVYVRIIKLILKIKKLDHVFVMADVFEDRGLPADYPARHPFRRIPSIEIDGVSLYETDAIAHYLDAVFPHPALIPSDPLEAARMRQIMRVVDAYAYRALVWDIYVPQWWREGREPGPEALAAGLHVLLALEALMTPAFRASPPTLGWCYLAAVLAMTDSVIPGAGLIDQVPALRAWWNEIREGPLMIATRSDESLY